MDLLRHRAKILRGGGVPEIDEAKFLKLKPKLRRLNYKLHDPVAAGANTKIYLSPKLKQIYGRDNLCLKVFWRCKAVWGYEGAGATSDIWESTIAQNLLALKGYAPRVYDLVLIDGRTAQVTDYLTGPEGRREIIDDRFEFYKDDMDRDHNYRGGKLIDCQGLKLKHEKDYKIRLTKLAIECNNAHGHTNNLYQSTEYQEGSRDTKKRVKKYQFKDFKDKNVLDIGCSNGMMCQVACDMGAKRVVGLDWPDTIELTEQLAILDGYFNIDFYGLDIRELDIDKLAKLTGLGRFDIHLFLAMETHVGWLDFVRNCKTLYYEGHGAVRPFRVEHH